MHLQFALNIVALYKLVWLIDWSVICGRFDALQSRERVKHGQQIGNWSLQPAAAEWAESLPDDIWCQWLYEQVCDVSAFFWISLFIEFW